MNGFRVRTFFGVQRQDDKALIRIDCAKAPITFDGLPVRTSDLCVKHVTKTKRWQRTNRPPKVRVRHIDMPTIMIVHPPLTPRETVICHPSLLDKLDRR